jgi:hypothetical protein
MWYSVTVTQRVRVWVSQPERPATPRRKNMKGNGTDEEFEGDGLLDETDEVLDDEVNTVLDDATREELDNLMGAKVVGLDVWEESLSDDEDEEPPTPEERVLFDADLMFEDGIALELYAAAAYPDPDGDPVKGMEQITAVLEKLADQQLQLMDFDQADEEGGLALAFGADDKVQLVLAAGAWLVSEWEEELESEDDDEAAEGE